MGKAAAVKEREVGDPLGRPTARNDQSVAMFVEQEKSSASSPKVPNVAMVV